MSDNLSLFTKHGLRSTRPGYRLIGCVRGRFAAFGSQLAPSGSLKEAVPVFRGVGVSRVKLQNSSDFQPVASLTGLRGIAAIWVLLFHVQFVRLGVVGPAWMSSFSIVNSGWCGVDLFFVLSGFILMQSHGVEFIALDWKHVARFFKLRITRVYPLSAAVLALIAVIATDRDFICSLQLRDPSNFGLLAFFKTLFLATRWFLPGRGEWNAPVWSLSVEMLGYTMFPVLASMLMSVRSRSIAFLTGLSSFALWLGYQLFIEHSVGNAIGQLSIVRMACCFLGGIAISRLRMLVAKIAVAQSTLLSIAAILAILAGAASPRVAGVLPIAFATLIFALSFRSGLVHRALSAPVPLFFGKVSFPLYLLHFIPLQWLYYHVQKAREPESTFLIVLFFYLIMIIGVSFLLHIFVEKPSQRLGRRWAIKGC